MAKYFLTSGTGYIGFAAAKAAKEAGHDVTALARSDESAARLEEFGIKVQRGDIKRPETYKDILKQFDVVIHTAAAYGPDFAQVEEQTVKAVVEALKGTNKTFIYTSGVWVLGNTGDKPATEESQTNNALPLVAWRPQVEQHVVAAAKEGVKTIVLRPGIVYGNGGGIVAQVYEIAKATGNAPVIGNGDNRWSLVHVDDLAQLYVLAAEKAPAGTILHGSDEAPLKQREIAELVAKAAGVPGKVQVQTIEEARKNFGAFADGLALDQHVNAPKTRSLLNWQPKAAKLAQELTQNVKQLATPRK